MTQLKRAAIIGAIILGSAYMGDLWNVNARAYHLFNKNTSVETGYPKDYYNFSTIVEKHDGKTRLYFGNILTKEFLPVNANGTVGNIDDVISREYERIKIKLENFVKKELKNERLY